LKSGEWFFRFVILDHLSHKLIHLNYWSEFPRPPLFSDGGYAGPKLRGGLEKLGRWTVKIVKRSDTSKGFQVIPRRWVVERTFAWLGRCCRLTKDWGKTIASAEAWRLIAHIMRLTRMRASP
jgi:hypothetical protein